MAHSLEDWESRQIGLIPGSVNVNESHPISSTRASILDNVKPRRYKHDKKFVDDIPAELYNELKAREEHITPHRYKHDTMFKYHIPEDLYNEWKKVAMHHKQVDNVPEHIEYMKNLHKNHVMKREKEKEEWIKKRPNKTEIDHNINDNFLHHDKLRNMGIMDDNIKRKMDTTKRSFKNVAKQILEQDNPNISAMKRSMFDLMK